MFGINFYAQAQSATLVSNIWQLDELVVNGNSVTKPSVVNFYDLSTNEITGTVSNVVRLVFTSVSGNTYTVNNILTNGNAIGDFIISDSNIDLPPGNLFEVNNSDTGDNIYESFKTVFLNNYAGIFGGGTYTITGDELILGSATTYGVYSIYDPCNSTELPIGSGTQTLNEGQTLGDLQITASSGFNLIWYADEDLTTILPETTVATATTYYAVNSNPNCLSIGRPITVTITPTAGLNDIQLANLNIYPNPATDLINISYPTSIENIEIFDLTGRKILSKTVSEKETQLNISHLNSGIYILNIKTDEGLGSKRIIKK